MRNKKIRTNLVRLSKNAHKSTDSPRKMCIRDRLHTALMQLTKEERDFICALFFDEKTESEVAKGLGVSQQAVHKRKSRILKKLKDVYKRQI